ncbi:hypothetical protein FJT64_022024 [Amphibalanus amphitrite]|uniref:Uncharacterized protein n=1 Tax=Amphibalanus amphitrite TaxID=1232801 RepID=A0A6A4WK44_AMPAM|nr:hypothetical protein FJT64_008701 [Amphibalanus amphitrite]KAF0306483.1 hypothetical protein FJT64_022024 [Amphibalanus amphitrite]
MSRKGWIKKPLMSGHELQLLLSWRYHELVSSAVGDRLSQQLLPSSLLVSTAAGARLSKQLLLSSLLVSSTACARLFQQLPPFRVYGLRRAERSGAA